MDRLSYDVLETTLGWIGVLASAQGIRRTTLPMATPSDAVAHLEPEVAKARLGPGAFADLHRRLEAYFQGETVEFDDSLEVYDHLIDTLSRGVHPKQKKKR